MSDFTLEYTPKSAWEMYDSVKDRSAMDEMAERFVTFLSECKTERLVMDYARDRAEQAGFVEDFTSDAVMRIQRGKTGFFARKVAARSPRGFGWWVRMPMRPGWISSSGRCIRTQSCALPRRIITAASASISG